MSNKKVENPFINNLVFNINERFSIRDLQFINSKKIVLNHKFHEILRSIEETREHKGNMGKKTKSKKGESLPELKGKVKELLKSSPHGLPLEKFSNVYLQHFGVPLEPSNHNCKDIVDLLNLLDDTIVMKKENDTITLVLTNQSTEKCQSKSYVSNRIPTEMMKTFRHIIQVFGGGLAVDQLKPEYELRTGQKLNLQKLGFSSVYDLMSHMSDEFKICNINNSQFYIYNKNTYKGLPGTIINTDGEESSKDAAGGMKNKKKYNLFRQRVKEILQDYTEGLSLEELYGAYKGYYGIHTDELDHRLYGFEDIESLFKQSDLFTVCREHGKVNVYTKSFFEEKMMSSEIQPSHSSLKRVSSTSRYVPIDFKLLFKDGDCCEVVVADIYSPTKFWIIKRDKNHSYALDDLMDRMGEFYSSPLGLRYVIGNENELTHGSPCVSLYSEDDNYYRALYLGMEDVINVKLFYVDYGTIFTAPFSSLWYLHEMFFSLPSQAIKSSLYGIESMAGGTTWPKAVTQHFLNMVQDKAFQACINKSKPDGSLLITLLDTANKFDIDINADLVKKQFAKYNEEEVINDPFLIESIKLNEAMQIKSKKSHSIGSNSSSLTSLESKKKVFRSNKTEKEARKLKKDLTKETNCDYVAIKCFSKNSVESGFCGSDKRVFDTTDQRGELRKPKEGSRSRNISVTDRGRENVSQTPEKNDLNKVSEDCNMHEKSTLYSEKNLYNVSEIKNSSQCMSSTMIDSQIPETISDLKEFLASESVSSNMESIANLTQDPQKKLIKSLMARSYTSLNVPTNEHATCGSIYENGHNSRKSSDTTMDIGSTTLNSNIKLEIPPGFSHVDFRTTEENAINEDDHGEIGTIELEPEQYLLSKPRSNWDVDSSDIQETQVDNKVSTLREDRDINKGLENRSHPARLHRTDLFYSDDEEEILRLTSSTVAKESRMDRVPLSSGEVIHVIHMADGFPYLPVPELSLLMDPECVNCVMFELVQSCSQGDVFVSFKLKEHLKVIMELCSDKVPYLFPSDDESPEAISLLPFSSILNSTKLQRRFLGQSKFQEFMMLTFNTENEKQIDESNSTEISSKPSMDASTPLSYHTATMSSSDTMPSSLKTEKKNPSGYATKRLEYQASLDKQFNTLKLQDGLGDMSKENNLEYRLRRDYVRLPEPLKAAEVSCESYKSFEMQGSQNHSHDAILGPGSDSGSVDSLVPNDGSDNTSVYMDTSPLTSDCPIEVESNITASSDNALVSLDCDHLVTGLTLVKNKVKVIAKSQVAKDYIEKIETFTRDTSQFKRFLEMTNEKEQSLGFVESEIEISDNINVDSTDEIKKVMYPSKSDDFLKLNRSKEDNNTNVTNPKIKEKYKDKMKAKKLESSFAYEEKRLHSVKSEHDSANGDNLSSKDTILNPDIPSFNPSSIVINNEICRVDPNKREGAVTPLVVNQLANQPIQFPTQPFPQLPALPQSYPNVYMNQLGSFNSQFAPYRNPRSQIPPGFNNFQQPNNFYGYQCNLPNAYCSGSQPYYYPYNPAQVSYMSANYGQNLPPVQRK